MTLKEMAKEGYKRTNRELNHLIVWGDPENKKEAIMKEYHIWVDTLLDCDDDFRRYYLGE